MGHLRKDLLGQEPDALSSGVGGTAGAGSTT